MKSLLHLYREVLSVLPGGARRFVGLYSWLQAALSVLDVAALGLLALIIGPITVGQPVTIPFLGVLDIGGVIWAIVVICVLMISKSALAVLLTWWATRRIARYEVALGNRLLTAYLKAPWRDRLRKNSADILRLSDSGADSTINGFILPGATLLGEVINLALVIVTLAVIEPVLALITLVYVGLLALGLFLGIARQTRVAGEVYVSNAIRTSQLILEVVGAMKEVALRSKEDEVAGVVAASRTRSARAKANLYFLGNVPRYVLEAGLIGGFIIVGGAAYLLGGIEQALAGIAVFALAGFRIAPAAVRFQTVMSGMISAAPYPRRVLDELYQVENSASEGAARGELALPEHPSALELRDVEFCYQRDGVPSVQGVTTSIPFGSFVAFAGESGAGKSTMIDLILGLLEPTAGTISIDGLDLAAIRGAWRRRVGYVPQEVAVFDATLGQNVALTWTDDYDRDRARLALQQAQLWEFVNTREGGLDASVGERGLALSGGQRQRLGIARALYSDPLVLVMDEATSALDTQTEAQVAAAIESLAGSVTRVVVAHRLATIRNADRIFVMREGRVVASGGFDELLRTSPDFAAQAALAGLA